jgi:DNA-binding FadR family transcriptional regulator
MRKMKFEPLLITRTSKYIEDKIRNVILTGRVKPGDKLPSEKEMAKQFGVSIVTLREALKGLETFGLIEKKRGYGGGIYVSEVNSESVKTSLEHFLSFKHVSIKHLYEVRQIIEPPMIKLAAQHITPDEVSKLEENVSYCEEMISKESPSFTEKEFFDLDKKNVEFHRLIAETTKNPILILTVEYVFEFLSKVEKKIMIPDKKFSMNTVKEHRNLLEHLKQHDLEACEKDMVSHLKDLDEYLDGKEKDYLNQEIFSIMKENE